MPRRLQYLQPHAPEFKNVAIVHGSKRVRRLSRGTQIDDRAHAIAQLQMPRDKISVKMRQEYVLDFERVLGGKRNVLIDVPLRVNDHCSTRLLVANNVGSVREASQVELLKDHAAPSSSTPAALI